MLVGLDLGMPVAAPLLLRHGVELEIKELAGLGLFIGREYVGVEILPNQGRFLDAQAQDLGVRRGLPDPVQQGLIGIGPDLLFGVGLGREVVQAQEDYKEVGLIFGEIPV